MQSDCDVAQLHQLEIAVALVANLCRQQFLRQPGMGWLVEQNPLQAAFVHPVVAQPVAVVQSAAAVLAVAA